MVMTDLSCPTEDCSFFGKMYQRGGRWTLKERGMSRLSVRLAFSFSLIQRHGGHEQLC